MRVSSIQCDACCKQHKVDLEYDVQNLPQDWFTLTPGQGGGFKESLHFCCIACLRDYAVKEAYRIGYAELGPNFFDASQKPDRSLGDLGKAIPRLETR